MSWAKHWAILHHFWKQPFGREGTDQCDKLWLWKRHPMLHKAMQMQGFRSGEICYQYVNVYGFRYFVIFVSLIITFTWGIPTFTVLWEKRIVSTLVFHSRKILYFEAFFLRWTECIVLIPLFTFCRILSQWTWKALWIFLPGYPFHNIVLWFHIFHIRTWHLTQVVAVISLAVTSNVIDLKIILWQFWAFIGSESPCESQYNHSFDLRMYLKCYSCLAEFWKLTKKIGNEVSDIWFSPWSSLQNET